jgi:AraC-like DNA-binding protein
MNEMDRRRTMLTPGELAAQMNKYAFSITLVGHQAVDPSWRHGLRTIQHHSIWLIQKGKGIFTINGIHYPAEPGKIFFFTPGMVIERRTDPENPLEYYFLRFQYIVAYEEQEEWHTEVPAEQPFPMQGMYTIHNTAQLIQQMEQQFTMWKRRGHLTAMRRKIALYEFFLTLIQDFRSQKQVGETTSVIEFTQDYMINHYQEPLTLEGLAQMAGLSVSHYSRLFKKYTGYSPIDYLTHVRMDRAKELLVLSDYKLKPIAGSVGYADEFYFSRIFKKIVGVSPRDYAKRYRAKPAAPPAPSSN